MDFLQFVEWDELLTLHEQQLALYGGAQGFVDENSVRSVMSRPQFTSQYVPEADLADLAADYLFGFATTQGFSDGNKRTAVLAAERFLGKNGWRTFMSELDRDGLAEILREHMEAYDLPTSDASHS